MTLTGKGLLKIRRSFLYNPFSSELTSTIGVEDVNNYIPPVSFVYPEE